ncbi:GMC oxidoreductase [Kalymmatonema gypsitolerans NIES-4073]|nr:GMC oxidoreductase [Scytonema sp. NIES-4073]
MLIDARTLPTGETIETEVCIVGAAPAGITLAREFNLACGGCSYRDKYKPQKYYLYCK